VANYYPELGDGPDRPARFLAEVTRASASLCAGFMVAGFVHGVLNSDNLAITGEGFDYGPYRFLPTYDVDFVAAYFDHQGLYAYGHQPRAFLRNLVRLGEALRPLSRDIALAPALAAFEATLEREVTARTLARLGLRPGGEADSALVASVYAFLEESGIGYDRFFFDLHGGLGRETNDLYTGSRWDELHALLALYEPSGPGADYFERNAPCTLLIDEIESIWNAIARDDDWSAFDAKVRDIRAMGAALRGEWPTAP
jgi:uncharacterized protein YdiU (UPF0061 family)